MTAYLARRTLLGLFTLVLISFVIYGLARAMPGSPLSNELDAQRESGSTVSPEQWELLKKAFDLEEPWPVGYLKWLGGVLRGDLGVSFRWRLPVRGLIAERIGPSLLLSGVSLLLAYLLSVPLGIYSAHRHGKPDERLLGAGLYALYSFPSYVAAILLLLLFAVRWPILPVSGMRSDHHAELSALGRLLDTLRHMILPVTCFTYGSLAYYTRFVRSSLAEVLRQDYILVARAKGLPERVVLVRHAFRNTLIPFITMVGLSLPALVGGSVILERIFAWPGMGSLFIEAVGGRDYPLIMGIAMLLSVVTLVGTLLADVLYSVVDPRVRRA